MSYIPIQKTALSNAPLSQILQDVGVISQSGLTSAEAGARLQRYGPNVAVDGTRQPLWLQFILRFRNPLILLLFAASVLAAITGDVTSFIIIVTILLLSVTLDFFQEVRAEKTADALRQSVALKAEVMRDGALSTLLVREIVPGDIVMLSPGMLLPADGRLITVRDLYVNQSLLTGESFPAGKRADDLTTPVQNLDEMVNAVFMGTSVISGTGSMVVCNTGSDTQLGHLAGQLAGRPPPTAFEKGIERFGLLLLQIAMAMVLFVLLVNIAFHRPLLESFLFALALAVGLAPELLPMIMTITLSRGAVRMAREKAIVKHLPAMHNLGAMDVLCTDKTGTLTEASIQLEKAINTEGQESEHVFMLAYLNSYFESGMKTPLDQAILHHAKPELTGWTKIDEVPFDFERRRISVLVQSPEKHLLIVKGAPEDILAMSTHYEDVRGQLQNLDNAKRSEFFAQFETFGEEGFRVLGIAYREVKPSCTTAMVSDETELTFVGFLTFLDPPKYDAAATLQAMKNDGIQVKIITGDNERVTRHVCEMLGFDMGEVLTGTELAHLTDEAFLARIDKTHVFCRITPQQKSHIIATLQKRGHTVGFMGDGINDAVALHSADVGISVDSGTDVAKEAADVIMCTSSDLI